MPETGRLYGIVIKMFYNKMFYNDHRPPHFHAEYGGDIMRVAIDTLAVIGGELPPRATGMVMEWAAQHQKELREAWEHARQNRSSGVTGSASPYTTRPRSVTQSTMFPS